MKVIDQAIRELYPDRDDGVPEAPPFGSSRDTWLAWFKAVNAYYFWKHHGIKDPRTR